MYLKAPVFKLRLLQVPGGCVPRGLDPGADGGGGEGRYPRDVAAHPRHQRPGVGGAHNTQGQQRSVGPHRPRRSTVCIRIAPIFSGPQIALTSTYLF